MSADQAGERSPESEDVLFVDVEQLAKAHESEAAPSDQETLGMSNLGTLVQVVGPDEAAPVLERIERFERDRAKAVRTLGRAAWGQ
jgi:hypothetical protein